MSRAHAHFRATPDEAAAESPGADDPASTWNTVNASGMDGRVLAMAIALAFVGLGPAVAEDARPVSTPSFQAKTFVIDPEDSNQVFMCENGHLQSVLATAIAEHRIVSVRLVDASKSPIPDDVWASPVGFRLEHGSNLKIRVILICGP